MQILVVAHGRLAENLVLSAKMILGDVTDDVHFVNMVPDITPETFSDEVRIILDAHKGDDFLVLADLFGASPCNTSIITFRNTSYRLVTGSNLPMLIEAIMNKDDMPLDELWEYVQTIGKNSVRGIHLTD